MNKLFAVVVVVVLVVVSFVARVAISNIDDSQNKDAANQTEHKSIYAYSAAIENIDPVGEPIPVSANLLEHGEWVYRGMCVGCHGVEGDGNGAVWELADLYAPQHKLPRKPRNFTEAVFKIRSTPSGSLPTDVDLFKSISRGLVADQDMPAFKFLPERDRWAVVAYIKSLSDIWVEEAEYQEDPIEITESPIPDENTLIAGKDVYAQMQCAKCHGELGKGDGPSAPELEDDNGLKIIPRDFSDASQFVGGSDPTSVFQTFNTGLDGTPMPSFSDFLDAEQSWQLVWYVMSLRSDFDLESTRKEMMQSRGLKYVAMADMPKTMTDVVVDDSQQTNATAASDDVATDEAEAKESTDENTAVASTATSASTESAGAAAEGSTSSKESTYVGKYKEVDVSDGGAIKGKITFSGRVKKRTVLPSKDKNVCGKTRKEPLVLVGDNGEVQDAVVYLKGITEGKAWPEISLKVPKLDQIDCRFEPHVQVGRQGTIDIINSDPVLHNTHGYYGKRTAFNVALPQKDQTVSKVLKRAGTVKVDCDAHGWMLGWIQIVDSPYYFQTGEDGEFTIDNIPPGEYTMVVWQEFVGDTEITVNVKAGETNELDVEIK